MLKKMASPDMTLDRLNALPRSGFVAALADVFEHAPWVAEAALGSRPFATVAAMHDAMMTAVHTATPDAQLGFIRNHPELGSKVARAELTKDSQAEQGSLGLDRLGAEEFARFEKLNAAYGAKFGFPFIICVRRHTRDSILRQFERRLANGIAAERTTALDEIARITRLRLNAKVDGPGKPQTDGRLSTHVLDIARGRPAQGVHIALYEIGASARGLLAETTTNAQGRTDNPLIADGPLRIGTYELQFNIGHYFGDMEKFLGIVSVRFALAEPEGHYHVPLIVTPWSYTTYRGS
ncbi:MAG: 2-oxo-4-hydroxy-4-carboxy-5-ureidoimidazoline decarboxylase [Hyphomicrobiales bacterium]